jgi:poly(A) polymerase
MNAMALSVTGERQFSDPFGGLADLARGLLRTPATPQESFADDPLRMLRAARFVATLGVTPAPEVVAAMTQMSAELGRVTAERVQAELSKLLLGRFPRRGLELLVETGLADVVLPELPALRMTADEHGQHKDVYAHTLRVLEQAIELESRPDDSLPAGAQGGPDLTLRWAALLHDIGKPATREFGPNGRVSFHHHEVVGARMARKRLKELRYPKQLVEDVGQLVFLHLRFYGYRDGGWTDSAVRRYVVDAGPLLPRLHKLVRSDSTTRNVKKAAALSAAYDALEQRIARLQEQEELDSIRPDLDGNEIMQILGVPPGPVVGRAYAHLLALRMEHGPLGHDRAVDELRRWAEQESGA